MAEKEGGVVAKGHDRKGLKWQSLFLRSLDFPWDFFLLQM
jgi:hypothetical protein